jgi:hypothetical protein
MLLVFSLLGGGCADQGSSPHPARECTRNGVCDDGVFCNGVERCEAGRCVVGAPIVCDDGVDCTSDTCDETRWACRYDAPDADADGHADAACTDARKRPLGDDCDDADPSRFPGASELCDDAQIDEDCDPSTVGERDDDGDGAISSACCNSTQHERQCGPDCDDRRAQVGPAQTEVCDGLDNDCNGQIDEGVELLLFADEDGDHYGAGEVALHACTKVRGYAVVAGDCEDGDPAVHPGAPESCELPAFDRDCDGVDNDLPGGCACKSGSERACPLPGACGEGVLSCLEEVWSACSVAPEAESCNGLDDDCDGEADEGVTVDCYLDEDGDRYAAAGANAEQVCSTSERAAECPEGYTARPPAIGNIDCAPQDAATSPGASEACNGQDDDCDGDVDEGLPLEPRFVDGDGDGHPGTPVRRCATDPTSADSADDCMDDNALVHPGQDGVFASPACKRGFSPCVDGEAWRCKPAGSDRCDESLEAASWDYDCDHEASGSPLVDGPCLTGGVCAEGCGPSGFVTKPGGVPACGGKESYQICKCLGAQGGGCTGLTEERPYPCR